MRTRRRIRTARRVDRAICGVGKDLTDRECNTWRIYLVVGNGISGYSSAVCGLDTRHLDDCAECLQAMDSWSRPSKGWPTRLWYLECPMQGRRKRARRVANNLYPSARCAYHEPAEDVHGSLLRTSASYVLSIGAGLKVEATCAASVRIPPAGGGD